MNILRSLAALALVSVVTAAHADLYLVCNPALQLTAEEARDAFLGEKQLAGSVKLAPVDNAAAQPEFLSRVLGIDAGKYSSLWAKKGFREGLNAPAVKGSDVEVLASVKANPGGVGYVKSPPSGVTVIRKY